VASSREKGILRAEGLVELRIRVKVKEQGIFAGESLISSK
jgi:hypothetical protein